MPTKFIPKRTIVSQSRYVDFLNHLSDLDTCRLANAGFSSTYIGSKTGYSVGQVSYRLKKANIRLRDYRQGNSDTAEYVLAAISDGHYIKELKLKLQNRMQELEMIRLKTKAEKFINKRKIAA
jgi:hypothetical protein